MEHDDIDAVVSPHRPKVMFLLFVMLVGIGAALAHKFIPRGTGNDEEPQRVLIVQEYSGGLAAYLSGYGFDAITGSLNAWQTRIPEEMPELVGEEISLEQILAFADRYGYAYVALEAPQRFDFSGLDIEPAPALDEHTRFAVLSAGDFAFPHHFTKNPKPSEVRGGRGLDLMRALFEQPLLAESLSPKDASMDAIKLRSVITRAIDEMTQLDALEDQVATIMQETSDKLQGPSAVGGGQLRLVDKVSEGSSVLALADGRVMTVSQEVSLTSDNGIRLDMEVSRDWHLRSLGPDKPLAAQERSECAELLGGRIDRSERLASQASLDGKTVLLDTVSGKTALYAFDGKTGMCGLKLLGQLELPDAFAGRVAVGPQKVAAKSRENGRSIIHIVDAQGGDLRLGDFANRGSKSLTWLDDDHIAVVSYPDAGGVALVLLSLSRPDLVIEVLMPERDELYEVRPLMRANKASLLVRSRANGTNRVERVDFNHSYEQLFAEAETRPVAVDQGAADQGATQAGEQAGPRVVKLDPYEDLLLTSVVEVDAGMKPFDLSPDGQWVAYTSVAEGGKEVHLVRVPDMGGDPVAPITLTQDEFYDRDVQFSRDNKRLFWRTEHTLGSANGTLYSIRGVDLQPVIGSAK